MNFKQKLVYMFIGCLFTIAGYILASLGGDTTHAQQNEQVIDKIICRELEVVDGRGSPIAHLKANSVGGGALLIRNSSGMAVAALSTGILAGGELTIGNNKGTIVAELRNSTRNNGELVLKNKTKDVVVEVGINMADNGTMRSITI